MAALPVPPGGCGPSRVRLSLAHRAAPLPVGAHSPPPGLTQAGGFFVSMDRKDKQRLYRQARWRRLRKRQLAKQPFCAYCEERELLTFATVVDHIKPHRGDLTLFY